MCYCVCDFLIFDFVIFILRGFMCCLKNRYDFIFLLCCLIGFFFDFVEFFILIYIEDYLVYVWFVVIFVFDFVFILVVIVFIRNEKRVFNCLFFLVFKFLLLWVVVVIFFLVYDDFNVKNIELYFNNLDFKDIRRVLEEIVLIVFFLDICLDFFEIFLNFVNLCYVF